MSTAITKTGGGFSIAPANMAELIDFAKLLANSDLVPKDYRDKPGNCVVAIQMGGELGLSPMQSIQNIAVINGRPTLWGDGMLAVCLPHLDSFEESDDGATATCVAKRGSRVVTTTFSTEDAKRAGLAGKQGPWTQYPARMRKMRARGFCLRDICADVLRGIVSAEEVSDYEVRKDQVQAQVMSDRPTEQPPKQISEPKQERKSTPPPAAEPPSFAQTFPNKNYAGTPLAACTDLEILSDYKVWLESQLPRTKAKVALEALAAEFARRIEEEAPKPDPIIAGLEKVVDEQRSQPGGEYDTKESWGLESPQP